MKFIKSGIVTAFCVWKNPIMFLWGCCVPCGYCCMEYCNAKHSDSGNKKAGPLACVLTMYLGCCGSTYNRYRIREIKNIKSNLIFDILFVWLIPCCTITQQWLEVNDKKLIWNL